MITLFIPKAKPVHYTNKAAYDLDMRNVLRISLMNIRPKDFEIPYEFISLIAEIDKHLDALFDGAIDSGNDNALDMFIQTQAEVAKEILSSQDAVFVNLINDLDQQRMGDYKKKQRELTECADLLADTDRQITELKQRLIKEG